MRGLILGLGLTFILEGVNFMSRGPVIAIAGAPATFALLGRRRLPAMLALLSYGGVMALVLDPTLSRDLGELTPSFRWPTPVFRLFPPPILGVILFFGGMELAASVNGEAYGRAERTVLVVTAGVALWNVGAAYLAGLFLHHASQRGLVRLDDPD